MLERNNFSTFVYNLKHKKMADNWSVKGKVVAICPLKSGTKKDGNAYSFQEYVIEVDGKYPFKMAFTVFGDDKIKQYNIHPNDMIEVFFNIKAKEWNGRYLNTVSAWKVTNMSSSYQTANAVPQSYVQAAQPQPQPQQPQTSSSEADDVNNLPF